MFDTILVLKDSRSLNTTMFENHLEQLEFIKKLKIIVTNVGHYINFHQQQQVKKIEFFYINMLCDEKMT